MTSFTTVAWLLESTAVLVIGLSLARRPSWSASARHAALTIAIVLALLLPPVSMVAVRAGWGVLAPMPRLASLNPPSADGAPAGRTQVQPSLLDRHVAVPSEASATRRALNPTPETPASPSSLLLSWRNAARAALGVWIALSLAMCVRLAIGIARGIAARRATRLADDDPFHAELRRVLTKVGTDLGVRRRVELRVGDRVACPAIWCWWRPCVILSRSSNRSSVDWNAVLAHEVAHLSRRDHLTAMAAELLVCMLPWHPLSWWARRRLAELAEEACDDWAIRCARGAVEYAESLLAFGRPPRSALLAIVSGSSVATRVRRVLDDLAGDTRIGRGLAIGGPVVAALALTIAAVARPRDADPAVANAAREVDTSPDVRGDSSVGRTGDFLGSAREHDALRLRDWDEPSLRAMRARIAECDRTLRVTVTDGLGEPAVGRFVRMNYLLERMGFQSRSLEGSEQVVPESGVVEFTDVPTSDVAGILLEVNGVTDAIVLDPGSPPIVEHMLSLAPMIGRRAPNIALTRTADGHPFRLSSLRGRVVLLQLWATSSDSSQVAMTRTDEMAARRSEWGDRVAVVGVSSDDDLDEVTGSVREHHWNASLQAWGGPHYNGGSTVERALGVRRIPHAILIDGRGTLRWVGHPDEIDLEKEIERLVTEAP